MLYNNNAILYLILDRQVSFILDSFISGEMSSVWNIVLIQIEMFRGLEEKLLHSAHSLVWDYSEANAFHFFQSLYWG